MSDKFEEWDFRRRERIRNIPDWEQDNYIDEQWRFLDTIHTLIILIIFFGFWGTIIWGIITYA